MRAMNNFKYKLGKLPLGRRVLPTLVVITVGITGLLLLIRSSTERSVSFYSSSEVIHVAAHYIVAESLGNTIAISARDVFSPNVLEIIDTSISGETYKVRIEYSLEGCDLEIEQEGPVHLALILLKSSIVEDFGSSGVYSEAELLCMAAGAAMLTWITEKRYADCAELASMLATFFNGENMDLLFMGEMLLASRKGEPVGLIKVEVVNRDIMITAVVGKDVARGTIFLDDLLVVDPATGAFVSVTSK